MGVTFQVAGVKVNLLICELMLLSLELEEFFAIHDNSSGRTSSRTATATEEKEISTH